MADEKRTVLIDIEIDEKDAEKSIKSLDSSINKLNKTTEETAKSTDKLSDGNTKLAKTGKTSKGATDSMTSSMAKYAKSINPAVIGVAALVAIGKGLVESLKTNKTAMDNLAIETAALGGVMDKVKADVGNFTAEMLGLNDAMEEGDGQITTTSKVLINLSGWLTSQGITGLASYTLGLVQTSEAAANVEKFHLAARDGLSEFNLEVGKLNLQYAEQIEKTRELDQSAADQIATLAEAEKTFNQLAIVTKERLELEVALQRQALAAADGSVIQKREEDKLNEVLLKQETTLKNLSARRRELLNRQKESTNRIATEIKAHETLIAAFEKENAEINKLIEGTGLLADVTVQSEEKKTAAFEKSLAASVAASDKRIVKAQEESDQIIANKKAEQDAFVGGAESILSITDSLKGLNIENAALNKGIAISETIINTAVAVMKTYAQGGAFALPAAIAVGAIGAAQLATIAGTEFADGGMLKGNSHAKGGININAEGGEAVINKRSMANPILRSIASDINAAGGGKRFALGGIIGSTTPNLDTSISAISADFERAIANQPPILVLEDLTTTQNRVDVIEDMATLK